MKKRILFRKFWPILSLKNPFHGAEKMGLSLKDPLHCAEQTEGIYQIQLSLQRIGFSRHVCVCMYAYMYMYMYICMYVYICVYACKVKTQTQTRTFTGFSKLNKVPN